MYTSASRSFPATARLSCIEDVDECAAATHNCHDSLMTCVNRPGTFVCRCQDGFYVDQLTMTCEGRYIIHIDVN